MMLRTLLLRTSFALIAAGTAISCDSNSSSPNGPNGQNGPSKTLQQPTFVGSSVGVVKSSTYSASFVMGAQMPKRTGEQFVVGNAQGETQ